MELTALLGYIAAIIIGLSLGLIGGGGSILTLPVLVYLLGIDPVLATAYSLFIVGFSALVGSVGYMKRKLLSWKTAIVFAIPSFMAVFATRNWLVPSIPDKLMTIGSYDLTGDLVFALVLAVGVLSSAWFLLKSDFEQNKNIKQILFLMIPAASVVFIMRQWVIPNVPDHLFEINNFAITKNLAIMLLFALIMFASAFSMIKKPKSLVQSNTADNTPLQFNYPLIMIEGALVGVVTGLVGAGGGFLIIPALVILAKLPMKQAVGTSLVIIAVKSLVGFVGDMSHQNIDWSFLLLFTGIASIGIFIGNALNEKIDADKLKTGFGWFVLAMSLYILSKELIFK